MGTKKGVVIISKEIWSERNNNFKAWLGEFYNTEINDSGQLSTYIALIGEHPEFEEIADGEAIPEYRFTFHLDAATGAVTRDKAERIEP